MSDESLFREVDEEVRRDQMEKLWKRYGNYIVAASVGVILAVSGVKGWQYWQVQQAEKAGQAYYDAQKLLAEGKSSEADASFGKIASSGHAGAAVLARFQQAGALAADGKKQEAVKAFDAISADSKIDTPLRDLARVRAAYLLADSAGRGDLEKRLAGLDVPGSAWRATANEIIALAAYREADYKEADKRLAQILSDPNSPAQARQRAQIFASFLQPLLGTESGSN